MPPSDFDNAFSPLLETLEAQGAQFHGATMLRYLLKVEPLIGSPSDAARLYRELSVLQGKRFEPTALTYADKALAADADARVLKPRQLFWMHVLCARVAGDVEVHDVGRAIAELRAALSVAEAADISEDDKLSLRQDVGMYLHEHDAFDEALAANMAVLADAERLYGEGAAETNVVLNNIAENHYKLGNMQMARAYLLRRKRVLEAAGDRERVFDTLFKLGVLSFEEGDVKAAKSLFKERLAVAKAAKDDVLIGLAKETLGEYYDRLGRARSTPLQGR